MELNKIQEPFNFILFGASGDLAKLKLFPSLYELALQKRFPETFNIIGYARSEISDEELRRRFRESVEEHSEIVDDAILNELLEHIYYVRGQYDQAEDYHKLAERIEEINGGKKFPTMGYFATPPVVFRSVTENLAGVREKLGGKVQIMVEKPFGEDRKSAGELFQFMMNHFDKEDFFLLDHYLGKAPVQSILPLRYNNRVLNVLLKGKQISNIQITAMETLGVDERIGFFEQVGIVKDMIQSHLLQVLALMTMSMPVDQQVHSIRREKGNVLSALRYDSEGCGVALAQYESYKKQKGVDKDSRTPTFAALRCFIDLTDWYNVPIYIRTGKKLSHKHTYIVVEFKKPAFQKMNPETEANRMIIELYPEEKIFIRMVDEEGKADKGQVISSKSLACSGDDCLPPYARLILNAFLDDQTSFLSMDEILASWHFVDSINECVKSHEIPILTYKDGSEGPEQHYQLTKEDNFEWYDADFS